jgi:enoyl-CoA hydratase/carnithine racemase
MAQQIITELRGPVLVITINRPEAANQLNIACLNQLVAALLEAEAAQACRSVILTAVGEYFCNGGELGDYRRQSPVAIREFGESFIALHQAIVSLPKPVIAAVQGHAAGGGLSLVEACDLAVASEAARFGIPEIKNGIAPMMALAGVTRALTRKRVMELALLGETIRAARALEMGLVNWVAPPAEVLQLALAVAGKLADYSPTAMRFIKKLYQGLDSLPYERQLGAGLSALVAVLKSDDAAEALAAREEGRAPVWRGK